jgi:hypothetical protein
MNSSNQDIRAGVHRDFIRTAKKPDFDPAVIFTYLVFGGTSHDCHCWNASRRKLSALPGFLKLAIQRCGFILFGQPIVWDSQAV